ncbi:amidase [Bradyrhizobium sp. Pear77]|uniref:amidase n=1 Tax=Bradyrhizobium altum TaxID=1571202 RepID=UPI001E363D55|nr:amidase [Bradyrhizobium altum]MCC8952847.1 amidase [Bradyrhizobium altum]
MTINRRVLLGAVASTVAATAAPRLPSALAQQAPHSSSAEQGLDYRSAGELRALLDARKISATELFEHAVGRIEALDSRINAVVVRDFERAKAAAREADAALARGERQPLLGIPMTVKEAFNICGLPTTWGFPSGRGWRAAEDAVAVARVKAAGAVILGKTNLATAMADWQSFNEIYGTTNNPWDLTRTPGGSSGGSAAALAAGYVPLELGSDISGSLRVPAHLCGVFAHKPTSNLVPQRGLAPPRSPALATDLTSGLGVCGPMARTAADLSTTLDVIAGPDEYEARAYHLALPAPRHEVLRDFRVLVLDSHPLLPVASDIRDALDRLAGRLTATGAIVARSSSLVPDLAESARLHTRMVRNFTAFGRPPEFFKKIEESVAALKPDDDSLKAWRMRAPLLSHHAWMTAEIARARLRQQWAGLFREFDVVVCPPFSVTAFPHDQTPDQEDRTIDIDGEAHPYLSLIVWATVATPPGLPATVMPVGRSKSGLPIGAQIIGPLFEDRTPLAFAQLLERKYGGFTRPPEIPL